MPCLKNGLMRKFASVFALPTCKTTSRHLPYSKILSPAERKKLIFSLRGRSDFHMLLSFQLGNERASALFFVLYILPPSKPVFSTFQPNHFSPQHNLFIFSFRVINFLLYIRVTKFTSRVKN